MMHELAAMTVWGWRPGPGDPTFMGWLITVTYGLATCACLYAAKAERTAVRRGDARLVPAFWVMLFLALVLLGVNKQLDLQSAITFYGRSLSRTQGWYGRRGPIQLAFIFSVAALAVVGLGACWWIVRRAWRRYLVALCGVVFLTAFVVIRATSFHHVDRILGTPVGYTRLNPLLEFGGAWLVAGAATWAAVRVRRSAHPNCAMTPVHFS